MRLVLHFIYVLFFALLIQQAYATDSTALVFANAVQAQVDGKHKNAIQLYQNILATEQVSSSLYNNLGLAYIKNKELGKAIVQFERALKLDANNQDAQHNLNAAQQRIEDDFAKYSPIFFVQWWNNTRSSLSSTGWAILFIILMSSVATSLVLWRSSQKSNYKTIALSLFLFSMLPLIIGFQQKSIEQSNSKAIIIKTQVGLRQNPDLSSEEIELIFEGVKVDIIDQKDSWVHIRLSNNLIGWVPAPMLEKI